MRVSFLFLALVLLVPVSAAQIVGVRLADKKLERKYKKWLTKINGQYFIMGEKKSGFTLKGNNITITAKEEIELYVVDQSKPERVPYKIDSNGNRTPSNKKGVVAIKRDHLPRQGAIRYLMRTQTISGLASEYRIRTEGIDRIKARRSEHRKGTSDWFRIQRELINAMERLHGWLEVHSFVRAAAKFEKSITKELRTMKEDAVAERFAAARDAIRKIEVPEDVLAAANEAGCADRVIAYEGKNLRVIVCGNFLEEEATKHLVELGEEIIEGFRREIIDPWVEEEDGPADETPDELWAEFVFVPDDVTAFEKFYEAVGGNFGRNKDRILKSSGTRGRNIRGVRYYHIAKSPEGRDFEGSIAHGLGHDIASIHFNRGGRGQPQDWLAEAMGYYASFEFLGRNTVTCTSFKESTYDRPKGKEGAKTVQEGQRAAFNSIALSRGRAISEILPRDLFDLDDADFAKSWSLLDYILHEEGLKGVLWLRACCFYGRNKATLLEQLRAESRIIFGLPESTEPFNWLDDRWRKFAKSGQDKGSGTRSRR